MFCKKQFIEEKDRAVGQKQPSYSFDPIIVPEDTYFLIYARLDWQLEDDSKRDKLDEEIRIIFGEQEKNPDGTDKQIDFQTYLSRVNDNILQIRKEIKDKQKLVKMTK